jgi:hypothetical protein
LPWFQFPEVNHGQRSAVRYLERETTFA